jgi:thiosulfate/3-mercaptopyruvate sulfurtransferase
VGFVPLDGGVRLASGRAEWTAGHIPGSAFADLTSDLSDAGSPLPMMMPPLERFAAAMSRLGVGQDTDVVLYDTSSHSWATRVWWMLRATGFDAAAVLDGGLARWKAEGRPLSGEPAPRERGRFSARPRAGVFVDKQAVREALASPDVRLVNALSAEEHAGRVTRTARPGHIPGSVNVPAGSLLDPATGTFLPLPELRAKFAAAGALDAPRVIAYCGGGIAATSDAFNLVRLGARDVAVYDGSLVEWSADPSLPLQTG